MGRQFQRKPDLVVNDFNSSILFDCRLYKEDITGSIAHATMLGRQGIIRPHGGGKKSSKGWKESSRISRRGMWSFPRL